MGYTARLGKQSYFTSTVPSVIHVMFSNFNSVLRIGFFRFAITETGEQVRESARCDRSFDRPRGIAMFTPKDWFILNQCVFRQYRAGEQKVEIGSAKI